MTWFPFDEQECILKLGSWTYHNASIELSISDGYTFNSSYKSFEQWYMDATGYDKSGVRPAYNHFISTICNKNYTYYSNQENM